MAKQQKFRRRPTLTTSKLAFSADLIETIKATSQTQAITSGSPPQSQKYQGLRPE
jgi:hypothetical protein